MYRQLPQNLPATSVNKMALVISVYVDDALDNIFVIFSWATVVRGPSSEQLHHAIKARLCDDAVCIPQSNSVILSLDDGARTAYWGSQFADTYFSSHGHSVPCRESMIFYPAGSVRGSIVTVTSAFQRGMRSRDNNAESMQERESLRFRTATRWPGHTAIGPTIENLRGSGLIPFIRDPLTVTVKGSDVIDLTVDSDRESIGISTSSGEMGICSVLDQMAQILSRYELDSCMHR
jgi:hypothetical protein